MSLNQLFMQFMALQGFGSGSAGTPLGPTAGEPIGLLLSLTKES